MKDKNILIYIDGAAFDTGSRLGRDRAMRHALAEGKCQWYVVELSAKALATEADAIQMVTQNSDYY